MLSIPFKWDDSVLGEGEHISLPESYSDILLTAFSSLSPFNLSCLPRDCVVPVPWEEECGITPKGVGSALVPRGWSSLLSSGAAPAVHWRAWACRLSPCHSPLNGAAFLQMSSVAAATTLQLKSKSQLSHLNALKYYFFFPPI